MSNASEDLPSPAPAVLDARGVLRWVSTNNPFYVLSAGLFLVGVYVSFGTQEDAVETWALMGSLSGYTLLLAATAYLLVRFAKVWDDVRTVLLLIVLMFLATSVTFDFALINNPARGIPAYLIGWVLAIAVSEGLLRGIRLKLPAEYRLPYYLILSLFFVYPLALRPWSKFPPREGLEWGLFSFTTVMGLAFLTLIPAIRRGPKYVENNGSPWPWPLYPWSLFGVLALAVPARSFLLCWSMHPVSVVNMDLLIFAPYFLVPFGFAIAVLLLEGGIVSSQRPVIRAALAVPLLLLFLSLLGHRSDPIYRQFFHAFFRRLGGDPLYITLFLTAAFYGYAAIRRVTAATEMLTAALLGLALIGPDALMTHSFSSRIEWLLAAAALQLALSVWQRSLPRAFAACAIMATLLVVRPADIVAPNVSRIIGVHFFIFAMLLAGAFSNDLFGRVMRALGLFFVLLASLLVMFGWMKPPADTPAWIVDVYPLTMAAVLLTYGWLFRRTSAFLVAGCIPLAWLLGFGWRGYLLARQAIVGLDYIVVSFVFLAVAIAVSLGKAGLLPEAIRISVEKVSRRRE